MRRYSLSLSFPVFFACFFSGSVLLGQGQKISQFERAGMCDFLIDKTGVYHAVFQESPDHGKPVFIYYAVSKNKGVTWSKPVTISNDNTGNGAGYPKILQDGRGVIYAIWKRYGNKASQYPVPDVLLDGSGGYTLGTLFYKALNGNTWSDPIQLNEVEEAQNSWFAALSPQGNVYVFWTQASAESIKSNLKMWYYNDYLRTTALNGITHSAFTDLNKPNAPAYPGGAPPKEGAINLHGYITTDGTPHLIFEEQADNVQQIKYFDGKSARVLYSYPKYSAGNTFTNPPRLLTDENGNDHLVFKPSAEKLESEQVWDMNLATNQTNILLQIQKKGVTIKGFQAVQGPKGAMAVTVEAGSVSGNTDAFGIFYQNGVWKNVGLTNNAARENYFYKEFPLLGANSTYLATLTRYNSEFISIAYDASGRKNMLMTISAYWSTGAYNTSSPSILFSPVDK